MQIPKENQRDFQCKDFSTSQRVNFIRNIQNENVVENFLMKHFFIHLYFLMTYNNTYLYQFRLKWKVKENFKRWSSMVEMGSVWTRPIYYVVAIYSLWFVLQILNSRQCNAFRPWWYHSRRQIEERLENVANPIDAFVLLDIPIKEIFLFN